MFTITPRRFGISHAVAGAAGGLLPLLFSAAAWAEESAAAAPPVVDTGDTAWVLTASALVLMMTLPGLALFMQCFLSAGIVGVLWILIGYSLAFGTGGSFLGDLSKIGLSGVTLDSVTANFATPPRNIPEYVFIMFQAMFAIITPALILGAIAERMKFSAWIAFITLWLLLVYCPLAHMVWSGEGWIFKAGAIDFAGGLVVHMSSGFSAIIAALLLGKRQGFGKDPMPPHNLPLCLVGAGLLWTGWFGFNAGSALSASPLATLAFLNTSTATSTAVVTWALIEWIHRGKPTALGGATAAVAGLVAITPACGNVSPLGSIAVGFGVTVISYVACTFMKPALGYDDSLDVFGVHGLGGAWGALASGLFAVTLGSGVESNAQQIMVQLKGIAFVIVFAPLMTLIILMALQAVFGSLRVTEEEEFEGLDLTQHSENAYALGAGSSIASESTAMSSSHAPVLGALAKPGKLA
jgi:Amt family ammonium transporter